MKKKYLKERKAKLNKEYYKDVESYRKDNEKFMIEYGSKLHTELELLPPIGYEELLPPNAPSWMKKTPVEKVKSWNTPDNEPNYKKDITNLAWDIANNNTMEKEKKKKEEDEDEWLILN